MKIADTWKSFVWLNVTRMTGYLNKKKLKRPPFVSSFLRLQTYSLEERCVMALVLTAKDINSSVAFLLN